MAFKSGENFSAVDVCVVDQDVGKVDFIKRGGTPTIIKKGNQAIVVEGDNLPIGIMEQSTTNIKSYYLNSGDVVVLASDGVFDAFINSEDFAGFINNLPVINIDEFAHSILNYAIKLNRGVVKDDMTVLVMRILLNR